MNGPNHRYNKQEMARGVLGSINYETMSWIDYGSVEESAQSGTRTTACSLLYIIIIYIHELG